jgi:hypothetical protein
LLAQRLISVVVSLKLSGGTLVESIVFNDLRRRGTCNMVKGWRSDWGIECDSRECKVLNCRHDECQVTMKAATSR